MVGENRLGVLFTVMASSSLIRLVCSFVMTSGVDSSVVGWTDGTDNSAVSVGDGYMLGNAFVGVVSIFKVDFVGLISCSWADSVPHVGRHCKV